MSCGNTPSQRHVGVTPAKTQLQLILLNDFMSSAAYEHHWVHVKTALMSLSILKWHILEISWNRFHSSLSCGFSAETHVFSVHTTVNIPVLIQMWVTVTLVLQTELPSVYFLLLMQVQVMENSLSRVLSSCCSICPDLLKWNLPSITKVFWCKCV